MRASSKLAPTRPIQIRWIIITQTNQHQTEPSGAFGPLLWASPWGALGSLGYGPSYSYRTPPAGRSRPRCSQSQAPLAGGLVRPAPARHRATINHHQRRQPPSWPEEPASAAASPRHTATSNCNCADRQSKPRGLSSAAASATCDGARRARTTTTCHATRTDSDQRRKNGAISTENRADHRGTHPE